jgi:hypothetical protein
MKGNSMLKKVVQRLQGVELSGSHPVVGNFCTFEGGRTMVANQGKIVI